MRGILVALDLETTGLDIQNDSIIEIGAVKMREGVVLETYHQLINPGFEIGGETSHITGIYPDDLRHAPTLPQVLGAIESFAGDAPIIAHNVDFDLGFMRRFGLLKSNLGVDTLELASILMPRMPRYGLGSLSEALGIDLENAHRALDDARATGILYWKLWERALNLPPSLIYEIIGSAQGYHWALRQFFEDVYEQQCQIDAHPDLARRDYFTPYWGQGDALEANDSPQPVPVRLIEQALGADGRLAGLIEDYEERHEQIAMAHLVAEALNEGQHAIIEAGTGTGKSIAYLLPSALWSMANGERVVIATNTLNLQSQLIEKDIPMVNHLVDDGVQAVVMKGRGNYLCPRRLASIRRRQPSSIDEVRMLAKLLIWLEESDTGDRQEITLRGAEYGVWSRLSAQDEGCTTHRCAEIMGGRCPFYKAKRSAERAHIIIANHALLISDVMTDNHVLPPYRHLVIDEGHQLEEALTDGMTTRIDQASLLRRLNELGSPSHGIMGDLLKSARGIIADKKVMKVEAFMQTVSDTVREMNILIKRYYDRVYQFLEDTNNVQTYLVRISDALRGRSDFAPVRDMWERLDEYFVSLADSLGHLIDYLERLSNSQSIEDYDDHVNSIKGLARYLLETRETLHQFSKEPSPNWVYWTSGYEKAYLTIQSAPISVGQMVSTHIWEEKRTVVLTSATLRTDESYDYLHERLFSEYIPTHTLGSPFDYKKSTLLYIPTDMPAPNDRGYQKMVERGIIELAAALDGRVMVLFTSYGHLKETAVNITPRLALGGIVVYDQATGGSREALLDSFKGTEKAVLLGTRSFWQGVDIQGDDLSALVIAKLPFAVPSDPIFMARSEKYENAFNDYAVPDAILRFRQGFGRLIRTQSDRGIVTIFDSRVIKKRYGEQFLRSLPDCERQDGSLSNLASAAKTWLGIET